MYCDDRLCCAHKMLEFLHTAPYTVCVELKNFYHFVFCFGGILFVSCVAVRGCEELGWVLLGEASVCHVSSMGRALAFRADGPGSIPGLA